MELIRKRFKELSIDELYEILYCRSSVFVVEQDEVYQDLDFNDQKSTHLYFKDNGRIAAYLRVIEPGVKYPENSIGRLVTMREYRHRGLARQLMLTAINEIRQKNSLPIRIEAQAYLEKFYESLGFCTVSEVYIFEGLPHIDMLHE